MKITTKILILPLLVFFIGAVFIKSAEAKEVMKIVRGRIIKVEKSVQGSVADSKKETQSITVKVLQGEYKDKLLKIERIMTGNPVYDIVLEKGDEVLLRLGIEGKRITQACIQEYARDKHLRYLVAAFFLLLIIIGGFKGFKASVTLVITALALVKILLAFILKGYDPIYLAILTAALVTIITLTIIGGITRKTIAAIIGTIGGVSAAGAVALNVGGAAKITGFSEENVHLLMYIPETLHIDFKGLLFAGMIIGALGAVMDVGMSIASSVEEVKRVNPRLGFISLIRAGMNVGRDIMGTMANTLILAYTGGALPLLLVFMSINTSFIHIINLDFISTEIVRALAGSIGLILAIPLTTVIASLLLSL
ncbi:MAG: hypothetical protein PWQ82_1569 [Thermosediminibacterales bacterium]|nr:hypothetical protein [Thermosediminibacterales bacterium]MDK2835796.1 hypothetical protein [Thermosediminibacterales bacterium]